MANRPANVGKGGQTCVRVLLTISAFSIIRHIRLLSESTGISCTMSLKNPTEKVSERQVKKPDTK